MGGYGSHVGLRGQGSQGKTEEGDNFRLGGEAVRGGTQVWSQQALPLINFCDLEQVTSS